MLEMVLVGLFLLCYIICQLSNIFIIW